MELLQTWSAMPLIPKIYWAMAVISTLAFIVIFGMSLFGGDTDGDSDTDTDHGDHGDSDTGSYFLSLKSLIGFCVAASWIGIVTINNGTKSESIAIEYLKPFTKFFHGFTKGRIGFSS